MEPIIVNYRSLFRPDLFMLISDRGKLLKMIPEQFTITNKVPSGISGDFYIVGSDFAGNPLKSGLRIIRPNLMYGDRFEKAMNRKSLMLLNKLSEKEYELHFFFSFCPEGRDRSLFLTEYFNRTGIAGVLFSSYNFLEERYKRKKLRRRNNDRLY